MTALLKPTELVRVISSQLKALCEANYAASILKYMWVPVCQCMGKFAYQIASETVQEGLYSGFTASYMHFSKQLLLPLS